MKAVLNHEVTEGVNTLEIIDGLRCSIEAKDHQIKLLEEKIHYLLHHRFGRKSEHSDEHQGNLCEDDARMTDEIEDVSTEIPIAAHTRKKYMAVCSKRGGSRKVQRPSQTPADCE